MSSRSRPRPEIVVRRIWARGKDKIGLIAVTRGRVFIIVDSEKMPNVYINETAESRRTKLAVVADITRTRAFHTHVMLPFDVNHVRDFRFDRRDLLDWTGGAGLDKGFARLLRSTCVWNN